MKEKNIRMLLSCGVFEEDIKICSDLIGFFYYFENILIPNTSIYVCINTEPLISRIIDYFPKKRNKGKEKMRFFVRGISRKLEDYRRKIFIDNPSNITNQNLLAGLVVREIRKYFQIKEGFILSIEFINSIKKDVPVLFEIAERIMDNFDSKRLKPEELSKEFDSKLIESYFLHRLNLEGLSQNLIKEVIYLSEVEKIII
ncbi:MAG: hypothetical protein WDZ80_00750 [Candidatus Paceibacterota bacterium]